MKLSTIVTFAAVSSSVLAIWPPPKPRFHLGIESQYNQDLDNKYLKFAPAMDTPVYTPVIVEQEPSDGFFQVNDTNVLAYMPDGDNHPPLAASIQEIGINPGSMVVRTKSDGHDWQKKFTFDRDGYVEFDGAADRFYACDQQQQGDRTVFYYETEEQAPNAPACLSIRLRQKFLPQVLSASLPGEGESE